MRKRPKFGDVFVVPLDDGRLSFGRMLQRTLMAFYDLIADDVPSVEHIVSRPVLFKIWVIDSSLRSGAWRIPENRSVDDDLAMEPQFFKQDALNGKLSIHQSDGGEISCTAEECEGLERAAVWDPSHVEDRLRDHYNGVPNAWVESMKPMPPPGSKLH